MIFTTLCLLWAGVFMLGGVDVSEDGGNGVLSSWRADWTVSEAAGQFES